MIANGLNDPDIIDAESWNIEDIDYSSQESNNADSTWQQREREGWKTYNTNSSEGETENRRKKSKRPHRGIHSWVIKKFTDPDPTNPNKRIPNYTRITTAWRVINWAIIFLIDWYFIAFLFDKTILKVLPYAIPGVKWESGLKVVAFFIAVIIAICASKETNKDDMRHATAVLFSLVPMVALFIVGEVGPLGLVLAGAVWVSVYREKILTDAKVRRTPPKKERCDIHRDEKGRVTGFDKYNV